MRRAWYTVLVVIIAMELTVGLPPGVLLFFGSVEMVSALRIYWKKMTEVDSLQT